MQTHSLPLAPSARRNPARPARDSSAPAGSAPAGSAAASSGLTGSVPGAARQAERAVTALGAALQAGLASWTGASVQPRPPVTGPAAGRRPLRWTRSARATSAATVAETDSRTESAARAGSAVPAGAAAWTETMAQAETAVRTEIAARAESAARAGTAIRAGSAPRAGLSPVVRRRARLVALAVGAFLVPWSVMLSVTLPQTTQASHWAMAWAGLDAAEALAALATAVLLARGDARASLTAMAGGALLLTDAWFDVCTSAPGLDHALSVAEAAGAEVPLALAAFWLAARLLRGAR